MNLRSNLLSKILALSLPLFQNQEQSTSYYQIIKQDTYSACYPTFTHINPTVNQVNSNFWNYFITQATQTNPLAELIEIYKQQTPTPAIQNAEQNLGITIRGEPTQKDLDELIQIYCQEQENRPTLPKFKDLGIQTIIIIPEHKKSEVDYLGLAVLNAGEIHIISGNIQPNGIFVHEITHYEIQAKIKTNPQFLKEWEEIAGPYNHVIPEQKRGVIKIKSYSDGTTGPKYGYVQEYGGKDVGEDIATYTQLLAIKKPIFSQITESFPIYYQKLSFLHKHCLISTKDYTTSIHTLTERQQQLAILQQTGPQQQQAQQQPLIAQQNNLQEKEQQFTPNLQTIAQTRIDQPIISFNYCQK